MPVTNGMWIEQIVQILVQYRGIWGTLLGALIGSFSGSYLQRRWDERSRRLREIYKPLFNEVSAVLDHDLPRESDNGELRSLWEEFDYSKKYLAKDGAAKQMEIYVEVLFEFSKYENISSELSNHVEYYAQLFIKAFPSDMITERDDGGINLHTGPNQGMNLYIWLNRYGHFIYMADSAEDLRKQLVNYSTDSGNDLLFAYWNEKIPDWHQCIWSIKTDLRLNGCKKLQEKGEAYASLQDEAVQLRSQLGGIIESKWFQPARIPWENFR